MMEKSALEIKKKLANFQLFSSFELLPIYIKVLAHEKTLQEFTLALVENVFMSGTSDEKQRVEDFSKWLFHALDAQEEIKVEEDYKTSYDGNDQPEIRNSSSTIGVAEEVSKKNIRCAYWPKCKNMNTCEFEHPDERSCFYGEYCVNPKCSFQHEKKPIEKRLSGKTFPIVSQSVQITATASPSFDSASSLAEINDNGISPPPLQKPSATVVKKDLFQVPALTSSSTPFNHRRGSLTSTASHQSSNHKHKNNNNIHHNRINYCKYGTKCPRRNCKYVHQELDSKSTLSATTKRDGSITRQSPNENMNSKKRFACKYQEKCTRKTCFFFHFADEEVSEKSSSWSASS